MMRCAVGLMFSAALAAEDEQICLLQTRAKKAMVHVDVTNDSKVASKIEMLAVPDAVARAAAKFKFSENTNDDLGGAHDLAGGTSMQPSKEKCAAECDSDVKCTYFVYAESTASYMPGYCWLKTGGPVAKPDTGYTLGQRKNRKTYLESVAARFKFSENTKDNMGGAHDLAGGMSMQPSKEECAAECDIKKACTYFVYAGKDASYLPGSCWLKKGASVAAPDTGYTLGQKVRCTKANWNPSCAKRRRAKRTKRAANDRAGKTTTTTTSAMDCLKPGNEHACNPEEKAAKKARYQARIKAKKASTR